MFEGLFEPLHLLILFFSALIVFGLPFWSLYFWLDGWTDACNVDRT
jgi:hypothetical protein